MFETGGHPDRAVGRHQPAPLRRGDLHGPFGGINQLRLAVHMGVQPDAFPVVARDQMDAVAGSRGGPLGWQRLAFRRYSLATSRQDKTIITYFAEMTGFDP